MRPLLRQADDRRQAKVPLLHVRMGGMCASIHVTWFGFNTTAVKYLVNIYLQHKTKVPNSLLSCTPGIRVHTLYTSTYPLASQHGIAFTQFYLFIMLPYTLKYLLSVRVSYTSKYLSCHLS